MARCPFKKPQGLTGEDGLVSMIIFQAAYDLYWNRNKPESEHYQSAIQYFNSSLCQDDLVFLGLSPDLPNKIIRTVKNERF